MNICHRTAVGNTIHIIQFHIIHIFFKLCKFPVVSGEEAETIKGGITSVYPCSLICISNIKLIKLLSYKAPRFVYNGNAEPEILMAFEIN